MVDNKRFLLGVEKVGYGGGFGRERKGIGKGDAQKGVSTRGQRDGESGTVFQETRIKGVSTSGEVTDGEFAKLKG